jgi:LPXTG-motif cell wall-anchored protein
MFAGFLFELAQSWWFFVIGILILLALIGLLFYLRSRQQED